MLPSGWLIFDYLRQMRQKVNFRALGVDRLLYFQKFKGTRICNVKYDSIDWPVCLGNHFKKLLSSAGAKKITDEAVIKDALWSENMHDLLFSLGEIQKFTESRFLEDKEVDELDKQITMFQHKYEVGWHSCPIKKLNDFRISLKICQKLQNCIAFSLM